jgi:hypothetical protein
VSKETTGENMSIDALNTGINGINQGLKSMSRNASTIAQANKPGETLETTSALVNMKIDSLQIQASAKVVETADKMLGSLLDVTA